MKALNSLLSKPLLLTLIVFVISTFSGYLYKESFLLGDFNNHILQAKMFGIPEEIKEKGLEDFFVGAKETGWDGQFYYFISNDLLGVKDTIQHIDRPAYRYQRIGLSLIAKLVSLIFFQDWVSPIIYYLTSLVLILVATYFAANFFIINNYPAWLILFWSLGIGTQLTLLNGLPDAAADSLLILAILSLKRNKAWLYFVLITLAILCREIILLFPLSFGLFILFKIIKDKNLKNIRLILPQAFAVMIFASWYIYVSFHFKSIPTNEADGILGIPIMTWLKYFSQSLMGIHPFYGPGSIAYREAICLLVFFILLFWSAFILSKKFKKSDWYHNGLLLAVALMIFVYASFGPTVIMHYSGYMKAITIFFFLIPLFLIQSNSCWKIKYTLMFFSMFSYLSFIFQAEKVFAEPYLGKIGNEGYSIYERTAECLESPSIHWELVDISIYRDRRSSFITPGVYIAKIKIKNDTNQTLFSGLGVGAVNLSYLWTKKDKDKVVIEGQRSFMSQKILPGQEAYEQLGIVAPRIKNDLALRISLVQEGCSWLIWNVKDKIPEIKLPD